MEQSMSYAVIVAIIFSSVAIVGVQASPPIVDPGDDRDDSDNGAELCIDTHGIIIGCDDDDEDDDDDRSESPPASPPDTTPVSPPTSPSPPDTAPSSTATRTMVMSDVPTDESSPTDTSGSDDTDTDTETDHVVGDPMETATQKPTQTSVSNAENSETQQSSDGQTMPTTASEPSESDDHGDDDGATNQSTPTTTASTHRTVGHSSPTDSDDTITTPTITTIDGAGDTSTPSHMPASILRAIGIGAVLMSGAAYSSSSLSITSALHECAQRISEWIGTVGGIIVGEADDEILLNETSLSMLDHIESNPGVSQSAVADQLGVSLQTIYYSADELAGHDLIMAEKRYGNRRYFPAEYGDEQYHIDRKLTNMPETTESVLQTIQWLTHETGGVSNAAIAERIDRDPATVTHHLNRLEDNGLIVRTEHTGKDDGNGDGIHIDDDVVKKMN